MGKQIYILNNLSGNAGVAKIFTGEKRSILSINLNQTSALKKTCLIKCGEELIPVGSFYKKKTEFEIQPGMNVENIVIEENGKKILWSGNFQSPISGAEKLPHENSSDEITFENFLGGGFDWHRIRGNFIMFDYSIIHHILSTKSVYLAVNRAGYYCAGIRESDDLKLIAIAIPLVKNVSEPFSGISADVYKIKSGKTIFDALCVGIDKTGEFFISLNDG